MAAIGSFLVLVVAGALVPNPSAVVEAWVPFTFRISSRPIRVLKAAPQEATFGMGCFWEPAESLLKVDGVLGTVSGYTGNPDFDANPKKPKGLLQKLNVGDQDPSAGVPSYESVCYGRSWVEGVRVTYDPDRISYTELLDAFFEAQKPQLGSRQYGSVIFPHDDQQFQQANTWKQNSRQRDDGFSSDWTNIEYPRSGFYQAEGYHQNYWQKQRPRFALIVALLAIATGLGEGSLYPEAMEETVKSVANGSTVLVGLAITAERVLDAKVVRLD